MSMRAKLKSAGLDTIGPLVADRQPKRTPLPLSTWDLAVTGSGRVFADGVDIEALTATFGSPLHVVTGSRLELKAHEAIRPCQEDVGADVFYSYKTNPVPAVLEQLHAAGIGAEIISAHEFWLALELGVPADRIIYNGPAKSPESVAEAVRRNTLLINANSSGELDMIGGVAERVGQAANVGIRVALPGGWGGQFGLRSDSPEVLAAIRQGIDSADLNMIGLHSHRGLTMRTRDEAVEYIDSVLDYARYLNMQTGWYPEILDLGGSLACPSSAPIPALQYRLNRALATDLLPPDLSTCVSVGEVAKIAQERSDEQARRFGLRPPRVVLEPGRALTADTQFLLTTVLDVKRDGETPHVIVDAGINIAESVTHEYHEVVPLWAPHASADESFRIAGPICTPADVLFNNWRLPTPKVGDVLAIMDTGAYCVPFSTSFSFARPAIVQTRNGEVSLLRRAETNEDIIRRDDIRPRIELDLTKDRVT